MSDSNQSEYLRKLRERVVPQGPFNITPYFAARGQGATLYDVDGRELIDFAGGIGVMNVGHSHPKVVAALKDQAEKFTHTCFHVVMYEPYVELADRLCAITPGDFRKWRYLPTAGPKRWKTASRWPVITPSGPG